MPMPLEGLRVIDWTIWQQGPVASAMLGDLGAEVIKIESKDGGDPGRGIVAIAGQKGAAPQLLLRGEQPQQAEPRARSQAARGARDRATGSPRSRTCSCRTSARASPTGSASAPTSCARATRA
jgi:crotonobetainyl-CoA:carnitine CoA-transferase CaiB-like acyl-CoA transferase